MCKVKANAVGYAVMCVTTIGASSLVASNTFGQSAEAPKRTTTATLEEVLVQARRQSEDIQTVPLTVTAFDAEAIREAQIKTTTDVQYSVPGVYLSGSSNRNNPVYTLRGDGRVGQFVSSPFGVVLYFADVPLQANIGASMPPFDMQSIQVLKGPQGTLFGRNTTGGAILMYPNEPTYEFGSYVGGGVGNHNLFEQEAVLNLPIVQEKVAARIGFRNQDRDGYTKNSAPGGKDLDDLDNYTVRGSLLVEPTAQISNLTIIDYYESDTAGAGSGYIDLAGPTRGEATRAGGGRLGLATGDAYRAYRLPYQGNDIVTGGYFNETYTHEIIKQLGVVNRTKFDFESVRVTNIFGYRDSAFENYQPIAENIILPSPPFPGNSGAFQTATLWEYRQFTNELQFAGSLFDKRVDWLLGGFWLKQEPSGTSFNDANVIFNDRAQYAFFEDTSKAVFVNVNVGLGELLEGLRLSAGYRHTWDKQSVCSGIEPGTPASLLEIPELDSDQCTSANLLSPTTSTVSDDAPTYSVGLDWQINESLFTYIVHRHSYKAGGSNVPAFNAPEMVALQKYDPGKTTDVEVGVKSTFALGVADVRFNAAAFRAEQDDIQNMVRPLQTGVFFPPPAVCVDPPGTPYDGNCSTLDDPFQAQLIVNGGKRVIRGVELETSVTLFDWLTLGASGSFMDVKKKEDSNYPANVNLPGIAPDIGQLLFFPESSYSGTWRMDLPFAARTRSEMVFSGTVYHSGTVDDEGYPNIDPYTIVNMRFDWNNIAGHPLDLGFWMQNVGDEDAELNVSATLAANMGHGMAVYVPPRMYGMELRYRFGAEARR